MRAGRCGSPRPVFLAGREELLAEVEARLARDTRRAAGGGVVRVGRRGQTSVAVSTPTVTWARSGWPGKSAAEDRSGLAAGFGELAARAQRGAEGGDPVVSVHSMLAASPAPWLLVLMTRRRGPRWPVRSSAGPGRVLVTSRNQIWPPGQALDVPVWIRRWRRGSGCSRTGDADQRAALELAGELGGLPLALEQAAAYVQASGKSLAGYASLFRQRRADLLGRGEPIGYPETVATTWRVAFEDVQQAAPGAAGFCGCWRSARPRRSRCGCCCNAALGSPGGWRRRGTDAGALAGGRAGGQ